MDAASDPMPRDKQLRLLSIFHYIVGALTALFWCFPLIHFTLGLIMVFWPGVLSDKPGQEPPAFLGWFFVLLGGGMFLTGEALAACMIAAGRFLTRRTHYMFIFIVACCECMFMPFGTILGVFTIVLLSKDSFKEVFRSDAVADASRPV